jgi:hypothetical protein
VQSTFCHIASSHFSSVKDFVIGVPSGSPAGGRAGPSHCETNLSKPSIDAHDASLGKPAFFFGFRSKVFSTKVQVQNIVCALTVFGPVAAHRER